MTVRTRAKGKRPKKQQSATVQLVNPVSDHFPAFIMGNALTWQIRALVEIQEHMDPSAYSEVVHEFETYRPGTAFASSNKFHDAVEEFASRYVIRPNEAEGKTLVLCGAGPSLRHNAAEYCAKADHVWGCNSALTWLANNGHRVTHGFTVDQTEHMALEWKDGPQDVEYLIASTVHPNLADLMMDRGLRYRFFHNAVGIQAKPVCWADEAGVLRTMGYEDWLYSANFPSTFRSGSGLNSVTRALDVAGFMGFEKVYVLGADCALWFDGEIPTLGHNTAEWQDWLKASTVMHADGGHALASEATPVTMHGEIDGRVWLTKPDMVISAQWLVKMAQKSEGRIELVGDTLPNALKHKPDEFLHRLPNFVDSQGRLANLPY